MATAAFVAALLLVGTAAHAKQTSASKSPRVTGPLRLAGSGCGKDEARHEGKVIARLHSCLRLYEFEALGEFDPRRDYGIGWLQTTVDAVNGWCATKVDSTLILPGTVDRLSFAPTRKITTNKRSRATVKITSDAGGYAREEGSVAQSFTLFPKSLTPVTRNDGRTIETTWRGRRSAPLAFALGAEISWEMLSAPSLRGGLGHMRFVKSKRC